MISDKKNSGNHIFGNKGEDQANTFLLEKGFQIVRRNYRYKKIGEIDIIALKGNLLVFCEVKRRSNYSYGGAIFSISRRKKQKIRILADYFLNQNSSFYNENFTFRFDLIAIQNDKLEWIQDIIR